MLDWLWQGITGIVSGIGNMLSNLAESLHFEDILSRVVGIVPRSVNFLCSLISPLIKTVEKIFGSPVGQITGTTYIGLLFASVLGLIVAIGFRRGMVK